MTRNRLRSPVFWKSHFLHGMSKVLIIGAGGVGGVAAHKCAQFPEVFTEICLASRTHEKCRNIASQVKEKQGREIQTAEVDANDARQTAALIERFQPDLLLNLAPPFQDLNLMEACLRAGIHYVDTANYEAPEKAGFEYARQWEYHGRFREKGVMALLGCGFDPGVTNVYCAYARKHWFDEIHCIDILDANAGEHGLPFATNFDPETNIREITAPGRYWEDGEWIEVPPLSVHKPYTFPDFDIGEREIYLLYHEELESLVKHIGGLKRIRFWMTFSENYLRHLRALENAGMTGIAPVVHEGRKIVPLQFLKSVLPDPASLGPRTRGKTCIGCLCEGVKDGRPRKVFIYNICVHEDCYREVCSQAVSYTAGAPPVAGARLLLDGKWAGACVFNLEQPDPDPFMEIIGEHGLPWQTREL